MTDTFSRLTAAVATAKGERPAEVVLTNGRLVDVHCRRVIEGRTVALSRGLIVWTGPPDSSLTGPETEVVDLQGSYIIPGLIDAHTHLDSIWLTSEFARLALPFGNTTCVTETAMMAAALGRAGVELYMEEATGLPMRVFFLCPSLVPPFPDLETSTGLSPGDFESLISRPDVVGLGETYWPPVVAGEERALTRLARTLDLNKSAEGHSAGAHGARLAAYSAAGVQSCHEATDPAEARARLDMGLAVQIREGYIRREMEAVLPGLTNDELDSGLVMLTTDVGDPRELVDGRGGMNLLLAKAVGLGVDPIRAVRLATLYPARHFNLRRLGAICPGNLADAVVVKDLKNFEVEQVWVGGCLVAAAGRMTVPMPKYDYPAWTGSSFNIDPPGAREFALRVPPERVEAATVNVRVKELAGETITKERIMTLPVREGKLNADPERDVLKLAHFTRQGDSPPALGLVKGLGLKRGAVATSLTWDNNNILVAGADDEAMAGAVGRLLEIGGGFIVRGANGVVEELPLPVAGIISQMPLSRILEGMARVERACHDLGWPEEGRPFLTMQTLAFTGLPFIRLTDRGLVDIRKGEVVEVVTDD